MTLAVPCRTDEPDLGGTLGAFWEGWWTTPGTAARALDCLVCLNGPAGGGTALADAGAFASMLGRPLEVTTVLYFLGLYETQALTGPRRYLGNLAAAPFLQALVLIAVYFFEEDLVFPRSVFVVFAALNGACLIAWRLVCQRLMGRYPRRRVLVVGANAAASEVIETVQAQA